MLEVQLLIIGGGAAGMAAALGAESAGARDILLVERADRLGGILPQCLHDGFGSGYFHENMNGVEYAKRFIEKMNSSRVRVLLETTVLRLSSDKTAILSGSEFGLETVCFQKAILASGCRERPIGALDVSGTRPAGIFTAGSAQKMVNLGGYDIGGEIVILGSGDIGLIMARQLTQNGKHIIAVVEKMPVLGGLKRNRIACIEAYDIPVMLSSTVVRVHGSGRIQGVTVRQLDTGEEKYIPCDTLVTSVGLIPERELAENVMSGGKAPDWLSICGNADFVHEIVDSVSFQSGETGRKVAADILKP